MTPCGAAIEAVANQKEPDTMLVGKQAIESLISEAGEGELSRSAYWEYESAQFLISADGTIQGDTVLGSISTKTGFLHTAAHWLLQAPFRYMGAKYKKIGMMEKLGRTIARRQSRQFTHDMLRQVLTMALVEHHLESLADSTCNLIIGDGFGVLTTLNLMAFPERKTVLINLVKPLAADLAWIRRVFPDLSLALVSNREEMAVALGDPKIRLIAVRADDSSLLDEVPIGIAFNVVSMQEMPLKVIAEYFRVLRVNPAPTTTFYCCNKLWKRMPDGLEISFQEYPWHIDDEIIVDTPCHWSQWIYSSRFPFWHFRRGRKRVIWHRMSRLKKSQP